MNNSALKLFHELMKKGWIDRNDNSLMWNLVEDNEARDELDQMGIELGFEIIQAQDRIYMVPTQDNDLFLKNNVDYRADIKATNEVRSRDLYLMNYLAIYILFIFFKGEGVDALTRDFTTKAAGLTVRDLQDIFGFATPQAIYKWQHGTAMPTIDNLVVLAAVMDVPMDEIIVIDVKRTKQISA